MQRGFDDMFLMFGSNKNLMIQMAILQGKTPISKDLIDAVKKYYIDKLSNTAKFKDMSSIRNKIWDLVNRQILIKYPEITMAQLLSNDDTKDTVKRIEAYHLDAIYIDKQGRTAKIYYFEKLLPPKEELNRPYILRDSSGHSVDLKSISEDVIKILELDKEFVSLKATIQEKLNKIVDEIISVEELYELLPELKKANIDIKATTSGAKEARDLRKIFRDARSK